MYVFDFRNHSLQHTEGGCPVEGMPFKSEFCKFNHDQRMMLYMPVTPVAATKVGIVMMHSDQDYSTINMGPELAKRGFVAIAGQVANPGAPLEQKFLDVDFNINFLKSEIGCEKVIIMGHSGGATLMTAYQRAAENGIDSLKADDLLYKASLPSDTKLTPADGIMCIDANLGNGSMTLISYNPNVVTLGDGVHITHEYDTTDESNGSGFKPGNTKYTEAFLDKFFAAQGAGFNAVIDDALAKLALIESGDGPYVDDMPYSVTAAAQPKPFNKVINQDISLLNHTKAPHLLLHKDGVRTTEIVYCRRLEGDMAMGTERCSSAYNGTLRGFLSEHAVRALPNYRMLEDGAQGIDWDHTFDCGPGNAKYIHAPSLFVGLTGSYEYITAEALYDNSPAEDKTCAFVEGADHMFSPNRRAEKFPGEFGDTEKTLYDFQAEWLTTRFVK